MYLWNQKSPSLAGLRPNQAMNRAYAGWTASRAPLGPAKPGLGAFGDATDPTTWLGIAAVVGLGWMLFRRSGAGGDKKKIARLAAQRALASRSLKDAGV